MNKGTIRQRLTALALLGAVCLPATTVHATDITDFGAYVQEQLSNRTMWLYGFGTPLPAPATDSDVVAREVATAQQRQLLAQGLTAKFVARNVAYLGDMITFWPNKDHYSHLIVCIEQAVVVGGLNASVQRVNVNTGQVETILYGMDRCDGIRTTDWGTIVATEETTTGRAYEIIKPLNTTGHWVADRSTGEIKTMVNGSQTSNRIVQRPHLGEFAWEGLAVLPTGVVIAGDELRPGGGAEGGAIFKFIPATPRDPNAGLITDLSQSPLVAGNLYALQVGTSDYGQGNQRGIGKWIGTVDTPVTMPGVAASSRVWASAKDATGYYRPEDLHDDPTFTGTGVRVYWTNTGNSSNQNYAETLTMIDSEPSSASSAPVVQTFVEGNERFNSHDNLDVQPKRGNVYVIEDDSFGEIWACLPDGADENLQSDGCVAMLSITDPDAEPTGFIFDGSGRKAFYHLQHGQQPASLLDFASNPVNGYTDDLIMITGFKPKK